MYFQYLRVSDKDQNESRQVEGIAIAKAEGKYQGRKSIGKRGLNQRL